MGYRMQDLVTLPGECPICDGPLTTPKLGPDEERRRPASPDTVQLCALCVAMALVRATVAIHGEPSPYPESCRCPGHEERMQAHQERVAREAHDLRSTDTKGSEQ